jgi:DNA-binding FrmR family transcriptional regulator
MPRNKREMERITLYVDKAVIKYIRAVSRAAKMTYSDMIRGMMTSYVREHAAKMKAAREKAKP